MKFLNGITVLVLGLGESGLAMARWCARCGANVAVWDSRESPPQAGALREHVPAATLFTGELTGTAFEGVQLILKSPGLAPHDERIAAPLATALESGVLLQGELELFAHALADLKQERGYAPKVIAITGTNGKTTTASMTAMLVERADKRVALAGNIGPTMLQTLADALELEPLPKAASIPHPNPLPEGEGAREVEDQDADGESRELPPLPLGEGWGEGDEGAQRTDSNDDDTPINIDGQLPPGLVPPPPPGPVFEHLPEVWVLELSSFQLHEAKGFEPSSATVLNLTQDHLDWHGDMTAYAQAKARVFGQQAVMVINRDDPLVEKMVPQAPAPQGKGKAPKPLKWTPRQVVRFGLNAPTHPGDFGLLVENGMAWLVRAMEADETIKPKRGAVLEEEIIIQRLMPADALRVRGRHNAANALAALALATAVGCPLAPMLHGLREYSGEPHRVEHVATVDGVDAFDDSKGTNVGATVAAIEGLGADRTPAKLVVILGGDGKGQDFSPLLAPLQRHARAVATIGRDAQAIEGALVSAPFTVQRHSSLEAATAWAFEQARSGDAVLLSPACASLDMFKNYAHRAEVFVNAVQARAIERGQA
ncbi:MAG: UDP-N-acetylmuramoyl-L-alanine--D-glutamate ligase [Burkholderiales bacterium]